MERYGRILSDLLSFARKEDFKGYDPYDALNSPILKLLGINKYLRIAFIQAFKRSPINLRKIFLVRKGYNPKGLGLFLSSFALNGSKEDYLYVKKLLLKLKSEGYSGYCWGYNFPWQSRVFYLPPYTPTIVNTSFVAHAFLDGYEYLNDHEGLEVARSSCNFILEDLNVSTYEDYIVFSYTPIDRLEVFNASLLGASLLARVGKLTGETKLIERSRKAMLFAYYRQNEDGSWYYGLGSKSMKYIDNFHTAFNLLALLEGMEAIEDERIEQAFRRGLEYYMDNLFTSELLPKYYSNKLYPLDIHSYATSIVLFSRIGDLEKAKKLLDHAIERMYDENGYFYFQEHKHYIIRIPYMRWSVAWMTYALSIFLREASRS